MKFQYYNNDIKSIKPLGLVSLDYWIKSMINPKCKFESIFKDIEIASKNQNKAEKDRLKRELYYFTPCVIVKNTRRYSNIESFTGLLTIDFDGLESDYALEFKDAIFKEYNFIICTWLSASKKGVRALLKIPICNSVEEFKHYFNAVENEFSIYKGFDISPKNCVLPMFMSYDKNILFRNDYTTFTKKIIPFIKPVIKQYFINDKSSSIEKIVYSSISKINFNGHPQLRAAAFALGGYVSAGYISESDAIVLIDKCINSNAYLSRKDKGLNMAEVYKTTAKTMITKGQQSPLFIK